MSTKNDFATESSEWEPWASLPISWRRLEFSWEIVIGIVILNTERIRK
jgi:hypothetical protein